MLFIFLMFGVYLAHRDAEAYKIRIENDLYERSAE